jgi:hypothetical protein
MQPGELIAWWQTRQDRTPLQGIIADLAVSTGRYNRVLHSNPFTVSNGFALPANSNRVGISVFAQGFSNVTTAATVQMRIRNFDNTSDLIIIGIASKEADVAAVTPSPWVYSPLRETVLTLGPIIQNPLLFDLIGSNLFAYGVELIVSPDV